MPSTTDRPGGSEDPFAVAEALQSVVRDTEGEDDRDTVVNLPEVFTRAYDDGGFRDEIDYCQAPVVQLNAEQRERIARFLQARRQDQRGHAE